MDEGQTVESPREIELASLSTTRVKVEFAEAGVSISVPDDGQAVSRASRAASDWLCDELGAAIVSGSIAGRVGVVVHRQPGEIDIVRFVVETLDQVTGAEHPMQRFGEIAAMGPVSVRLGRPIERSPAAETPARPVGEHSAESSVAQSPGSAPSPQSIRFEWIGPIITPATSSSATSTASATTYGAAPATSSLAESTPQATDDPTVPAGGEFGFDGLPDADAPGAFDVWLLDASSDPARVDAVIARVLGVPPAGDVGASRLVPRLLASSVSARECRRIEASLRYTTRAKFRAVVSGAPVD